MQTQRVMIITRSYLVDPKATDRELREMGEDGLAIQMRVDYENGRLAQNYETLTGQRITVTQAHETMAGAVVSPAKHTRQESVEHSAPSLAGTTGLESQ